MAGRGWRDTCNFGGLLGWGQAFLRISTDKEFHTKKMNTWWSGLWPCCSIAVLVIWWVRAPFLKTCQQGIGQSPVPAVAVQRSSWRQDIEMQLMVPWDRFWIDVFLVCFLVCALHFFRIHNFFQDSARWVKSFMKLCHWNQPFETIWSFAYLTPASIIYYYYGICFTYYIVT